MNTVEKYAAYVNTSALAGIEPIVFDRARGCVVFGEDGREYLDCFSGISVTNAGHGNQTVIEAAKDQIERYVHCCSYVYYNKPMADLAEKLAMITPGKLKKSFFANSGAEAVEGAMKLAKTYTGKREFIALHGSFHGRSYAALSITGNAARKKRAGPYMSGVAFAPAPYCYRCVFGLSPETCEMQCAGYVEDVIRYATSADVAAFVVEPVLGEGGIITPPVPYFRRVKEILDRHNILLLVDEVQTGFARTGRMFAIEHYDIEPDIMTLGKGIANGFPLSAFIAPDEIADAFQPGEHLTTFGGNPISCAASLATIAFLQQEKIADKVAGNEGQLKERLEYVKRKHPIIGDVRGRGLMIGIELVKDDSKTPAADEARAIRKSCVAHGLLIGVGGILGNVLRIQPPLVITDDQIDQALITIERAITEL